jgi:hypothetical protein
MVLDLLTSSKVKKFFKIDKKQRRYSCPDCLSDANRDAGLEHRLAVLTSKSPTATDLFASFATRLSLSNSSSARSLDAKATCFMKSGDVCRAPTEHNIFVPWSANWGHECSEGWRLRVSACRLLDQEAAVRSRRPRLRPF